MERHFCTYFDNNYLSRGLALYASLIKHCESFRLYVLCMDDSARNSLIELALPHVTPIALAQLEASAPELLEAKSTRSRIEYYFTCTAALPRYIMSHRSDAELVTYLDADLFFFASPEPLFDELGDRSVGIVAHRFPPQLADRIQYGIYNVGWLSFRNDESGRTTLQWWHERCVEWCYDRVEQNRFADQKYLDDWPARFPNVAVLSHPGANVAPWNIQSHTLSEANGSVFVDSQPLIFFHFHGLKQVGRWTYDPGLKEYHVILSKLLREMIYVPYIRAWRRVTHMLAEPARAAIPLGRNRGIVAEHAGTLGQVFARLRRIRGRAKEIALREVIVCFRSDPAIDLAESS